MSCLHRRWQKSLRRKAFDRPLRIKNSKLERRTLEKQPASPVILQMQRPSLRNMKSFARGHRAGEEPSKCLPQSHSIALIPRAQKSTEPKRHVLDTCRMAERHRGGSCLSCCHHPLRRPASSCRAQWRGLRSCKARTHVEPTNAPQGGIHGCLSGSLGQAFQKSLIRCHGATGGQAKCRFLVSLGLGKWGKDGCHNQALSSKS